MRFPIKKWQWAVIGIVLIGAVIIFFPRGDKVQYVTENVKRENLIQSVDANGEVVSIDEVDLSFDLSGVIDQVLCAVGEAVEAGNLLAVLDSRELIADLQTAYQAMKVAQGNLERERAGSSDETLQVSDSVVDVANASLLAAQVDSQNASELVGATEDKYVADTQVREATVTTAKSNFNQVVTENAADIADAYDDLLSAAWACVIEVRNGIAKADEILGVRNGTLNDEYETSLSVRNSSAKESAVTAFGVAEALRDSAEAAMLSADYGSSGQIVSAGEKTESAASAVAKLLLYVRQVVDATPIGGDFSVSDLTTLLTTVDTARSALQVDQAALQNAFQTVQEALRSASQNLEDAQNALAEAQKSLVAAQKLESYQVTTAQQAIGSAQALVDLRAAELEKARAARDEAAAEPRDIDLASYEAEVDRASSAYSSAQARLDKAQMRSPISGNVTNVDVEPGEQVVASETIITVQTTQEQFKIVADVSESDISKVSLGDTVELTFDAFGSESVLFGTVGEIDPAEKMIESVVYYEVTVYLEQAQQSLALRPGLSVDLVITTDRKDSVLTIPQRAVESDNERNFVKVLVDGKPEKKEVTTGLRGDLGRLEIVSGLEEGDEIIIRELDE
jgi:multidrug efflux pump subunit AcrA (membrane-fusion protein)